MIASAAQTQVLPSQPQPSCCHLLKAVGNKGSAPTNCPPVSICVERGVCKLCNSPERW